MIVTNEYLLNIHWVLDIIVGVGKISLKINNSNIQLWAKV